MDACGRSDLRLRSNAVIISVISWWFAAASLIIALVLAASTRRVAATIALWTIAVAALASLVGWASSIGSLLHDRGRIRAGAYFLMAIPFESCIFAWVIMHSTIFRLTDPLTVGWLVSSGLLLLIATLLICAPSSEAEAVQVISCRRRGRRG